MKTRFTLALALAAAATAVHLPAQAPATSRTRAHVTTLASPKFEGRLAGSPGERLASEYIVSQLKRIGARPLPGRTDYRLPFEFTAGTKDGGSSIDVRSAAASTAGSAAPQNVASAFSRTYNSRDEIQALSFSDNGDVTGPVA